jgi:hypothetical protein
MVRGQQVDPSVMSDEEDATLGVRMAPFLVADINSRETETVTP